MRLKNRTGRFGTALLCLGLVGSGLVFVPARAAVDEAAGTVTDERLAAGIPLGGIGAGKVELLTDGTFGNLTANNNWDRPVAELPASFFAIRTQVGDRSDARVLALRSAYGFPTVGSVQFEGLYPRARVRYADPALPLDVALHAYSPLVPHNLKDSTLPAAVFSFTLTNKGQAPVETSLGFSWENVVGRGGTSKEEWIDRTGNRQEARAVDGHTGVVFFSDQKADGQRKNSAGQYAITGGSEGGKSATLEFWNAGGDGRDFWTAFSGTTFFGEKPLVRTGVEGNVHPAAATGVTVTVPPGGSREILFSLGWHMPSVVTGDGKDLGHAYTRNFADAWSAARYAAEYHETLLSGTTDWQELLLRSDLPSWLKHKLLNDAFPLTSNSVYTADGRFTLLENSGTPDPALGGLDHWLLTRTFLGTFFPELDRAELRLFSELAAPAGERRRTLGTLWSGFGEAGSPTGSTGWPDVSCNYILAVYRQYRWTGDADALRTAYPSVVQSLDWLRSRDTDGDGIPEGGSTFSYRQYPGTFVYTAGLYLAALRAGEALARAAADAKTEAACRDRFAEAKSNATAQLWNGRFFTKYLNPVTAERSGNLFASALAGEWAGGLLGLPELFDRRAVDTGLRSLLDLVPAAAPFSPPNEVTATGALDPQLSDQSWAAHLETYLGALAIDRNRADAGLGLVQRIHNTQWSVSRSLYDAPLGYQPRTGQRLGARSHVTSLASWNVYAALAGLTLDEPGGRLMVAPSLPTSWEGLSAPLYGPRYWAWMDFARSPNNAATNLRVKLLKKFDDRPVTLTSLVTTAPAGARVEDLTVLVTGPQGPLEGRGEITEGRITYTFKLPYEWRLNDTLEVTLVPPAANNIMVGLGPNKILSYGSPVQVRNLQLGDQTRFTLVNPTRERQVVNIRFPYTETRSYDIYRNGAQVGRFTADTRDERLTLIVPASPLDYRRTERLRQSAQRLQAARDQAATAGKSAAQLAPVDALLDKLYKALRADEGARAVQVLLHPAKTKLKDAPALVTPTDPEPDVVAAEEALEEAARLASDPAATSDVKGVLLQALHPVQVALVAEGDGTPGSAVRLRLDVSNASASPVRVSADVALPAGWEGGALRPSVQVAAGQKGSVQVETSVPAQAPAQRVRLTGKATITANDASWEVPLSAVLGHAYVSEWSVVGSWPSSDGNLEAKLPPDSELAPNKSYDGRRWHVVKSQGARVDLGADLGEGARGIAYAVTQVYASTEQDVVLELRTDGGALVRLNGERVHLRARALAGDQPDRIPLHLRQGWNLLSLKLSREGNAWSFRAEITDRSGNTPEGLKVKPELGG